MYSRKLPLTSLVLVVINFLGITDVATYATQHQYLIMINFTKHLLCTRHYVI